MKMKKYLDFGCKLGKLAYNLEINITKMEKILKSKKFEHFPHVHNIHSGLNIKDDD